MPKSVLITGAAKRLGAACASRLHSDGYNILIHYQNSAQQALQLCDGLNNLRPNSAQVVQGNLLVESDRNHIAAVACSSWEGIDVLVNNASSFYPTPFNQVTVSQWEDLIGTNLKGPFFLIQALRKQLAEKRGCIVNLIDIHAERGLADHSIYCIAKAGLAALTRILAKELAPNVRINGVAPGAILWPETGLSETVKADILDRIPLARNGHANDIANAVAFLIQEGGYITGQILTVDGGRTLFY